MCWYEDKGARPEGSGCSVWTSAGAHGSRTQAELAINMDVHQAPCVLCLPCLSLCAATVRCVPANSINGTAAATSSHAEVINKHPQMARNDSPRSGAAGRRASRPVAHSSVCLTAEGLCSNKLLSERRLRSGWRTALVKLHENVTFRGSIPPPAPFYRFLDTLNPEVAPMIHAAPTWKTLPTTSHSGTYWCLLHHPFKVQILSWDYNCTSGLPGWTTNPVSKAQQSLIIKLK